MVKDCLPDILTRREQKMAGETADNDPQLTVLKFETKFTMLLQIVLLIKMEESFSKTREMCTDFVC